MAQVTPHAAFARRSPSGRKLTSHEFSEARRPHASHMPGLPIDIHRPERATGSAGYGVDIDRPRSAIDADSDHVGPASSRRRGLPIGAYQAKGLPATAGGARRRRPGRGIRARGRVTGTPSPSATASGSRTRHRTARKPRTARRTRRGHSRPGRASGLQTVSLRLTVLAWTRFLISALSW